MVLEGGRGGGVRGTNFFFMIKNDHFWGTKMLEEAKEGILPTN